MIPKLPPLFQQTTTTAPCMSLREYYVGLILQASVQVNGVFHESEHVALANSTVSLTDAVIAALQKPPQTTRSEP